MPELALKARSEIPTDEAWAEVDRLRETIGKLRELAEDQRGVIAALARHVNRADSEARKAAEERGQFVQQVAEPCRWAEPERYRYVGGCGFALRLNSFSSTAESFRHCPGCGHPIQMAG